MSVDREQVFETIRADPQLAALLAAVEVRLDDDPGHDVGHLLRVGGWTVAIGAGEDVDPRHAVAAALLHDLVNVPKDSPDRARASALSAAAARPLLVAQGFDDAAVDDICAAIEDHSFSAGRTPTRPLGRALRDADRLEALGALGIMRCVSTGVGIGAQYFDPEDPWATRRPLDDTAYSVDHFFAKLLRLPETMLTEAGRAEAQGRADFMRAFLDQLADELGVPV